MADTETGIGGGVGFVLLSALLGYFVYGQTLAGALGMALLCIVLEATIAIGLIPFVGVIVQGIVNLLFVIPGILSLTGLYDTWLVTLLFILTIAAGAITTIFTTLMVLD